MSLSKTLQIILCLVLVLPRKYILTRLKKYRLGRRQHKNKRTIARDMEYEKLHWFHILFQAVVYFKNDTSPYKPSMQTIETQIRLLIRVFVVSLRIILPVE